MGIMHGLVLGLIQGLTEFFPVSSSGNLILFPRLFGWSDQGLVFDTVLNGGTLLALVWGFRVEIMDLARRVVVRRETEAVRFASKILVAALPGLIVGGLFGTAIENAMRGPIPVAFDMAFWGIVLLLADRWSAKRSQAVRDPQQTSWRQSLSVGVSQVLALMPGTSRSGITMTAGMLDGLDRSAAVIFSFYVSIPTISAAFAYGIFKIAKDPSVLAGSGGAAPLIAGVIAAAVSGAFAIRFLRSYVAKHSLDIFVWYRLILAAIVLVVVR